MIEGLLGKKIGMTHLFVAEGRVVPVTVLEVGPCVVTQIRTRQRDGYEAVQIGFGSAKLLSKPAQGHLKASGARVRHLREFAATDASEVTVGQTLSVGQFQDGDRVDVVANTKGRGFQGVVKRHGYAGGPKTHGQGDRHRAPGSIGAGTYPGRVIKGKPMPGHMGNRRVTIRKLRVEMVDAERHLLLVRGAVPGARNTMVMVRYARGVPLAERVAAETPAPPAVEEEQAVQVAEEAAPEEVAPETEEAPSAEHEADETDTPAEGAGDEPPVDKEKP